MVYNYSTIHLYYLLYVCLIILTPPLRALLGTKRMYRKSQHLYKSHSFNDYLQSSRSSQAGNVAEQEI